MAELLLDSLEIKGYRCFEHLTIEKLGRVNLIVGKNNIGKTNVLESIWIYSHQGATSSVLDILQSRDEIQIVNEEYLSDNQISKESIHNIGNLFYGRPDIMSTPISETSIKDSKLKLEVNVGWYLEKEDFLEIAKKPNSFNAKLFYVSFFEKIRARKNSKNHPQAVSLESLRSIDDLFTYNLESDGTKFSSYFIKCDGVSNSQASRLWDNISLTDLEEEVIKALKIISPDIKKVGFLSPAKSSSLRVPMGRLVNQLEPIPLRTFGEGMNRLLGITLALVNCKNGILLIDEIESGLHYSVLPDVWKLIFKTAKDLNVQVFATTHSKDCIEAFTQAAIDDEESEGILIRLERHGEKIVAKTIVEERLADAIDYGVEVR